MAEKAQKTEIVVDLKEEDSRLRSLSGPPGLMVRILAITLPIYSILYILNVFTRVGLFIYSGTYNAIFLAVVLTLIYCLVPATRSAPRDRVPWYDLLLAAISLLGILYIAVNYKSLLAAGGVGITAYELILGFLTILVLLEAARRTMGWTMVCIVLFFIIHAKFTYLFPGILQGPRFSWARVLNYLYLSNQGIFGMILGIATTVIMSFMIFGAFLNVSGAGEIFMKLSLALLGHVRGGAAKVAVVGSAMFGTVTGSPIAEVGVIGTFSIPLMKRIGYSPTFAAAVEAAAACGGVIDPPVMGAVAFVMADFTGIPYGTICIAAIIPAILYYLSIFFQLDLRAAATGMVGLPKSELPSWKEAFKQSWLLFIPLVVLVISLMVYEEEPTTSVLIALASLILLTFTTPQNRFTWKKSLKALESAGISMIDITPICGLAGIIVGSITLTGLGLNLSAFLVNLAGGSLLALAVLTFLAIRIMGMGVSAIATYILMAIMVAPALVQMGVPVIVAHFFIFYIGVSMFIEPPYCPAAYVAALIAGANPIRVGFLAMRLSIVAYLVPLITIYHPALLWIGTWQQILLAAVCAVVAIYALSVVFEGYSLTHVSWLERPLWLAGGLMLFYPVKLFLAGGTFLIVIGFVIQFMKRKRNRAQTS